jgi:hypothetical protein
MNYCPMNVERSRFSTESFLSGATLLPPSRKMLFPTSGHVQTTREMTLAQRNEDHISQGL